MVRIRNARYTPVSYSSSAKKRISVLDVPPIELESRAVPF
jgi:hypothetical protein